MPQIVDYMKTSNPAIVWWNESFSFYFAVYGLYYYY